MKIGLIELQMHCEVLDSLIRQLIELDHELIVYTNSFCQESASREILDKVKWVLQSPNFSQIDFIEKSKASIHSNEHVFIITPVDALCALLSEDKHGGPIYHCLVHNLNTFSFPDDSRPSANIARLVNRGAANIILLDRSDYQLDSNNYNRSLYLAYPQYRSKMFLREEVHCCIPGRVYEGRNYEEVLVALTLASKNLMRPLRVEFLGENTSEQLQSHLKNIGWKIPPMVEIIEHKTYIPQDKFDKTLFETDFLLLSIAESIVRNGVIEVRGKSCITGNVNDFVRFSLPAILPNYYPLSNKLKNLVELYDSTESMAEIIVEWVNSREFNHKKQNAAPNLEAFREECQMALKSILQEN